MTALEILAILQNDIHTAVFATVDENGLPQTCRKCWDVRPQNCISETAPCEIDNTHCLHCGNCYRVCPVNAVEKQHS